ncbi:MAG: hypothetical protein RL136_2009 [Planctomycetota bacterium]|jgi:type 1 glutamine amidotransferase
MSDAVQHASPLVRASLITVAAALLAGLAAPRGAEEATVAPIRRAQETTPVARERILLFSKTAGFRHQSIPDGIKAIRGLLEGRYEVDASEDSSVFNTDNLKRYKAVVFVSTTGDILDEVQQKAFEAFIRAGGGYAGVHAAADTEHSWPWYGQLVGAYFKTHPKVQTSTVVVEDRSHRSTRMLPSHWQRTDEWYVYDKNPRGRVKVLASLDTSTVEGANMGSDHPIAWYHEFEGGRAWYTGGGHTSESFSEDLFLKHLEGGILWAASASDDAPPQSNPLDGAK